MIYISTVKTLPEIPELNEEDSLYILYKNTETVKMADVEILCNMLSKKHSSFFLRVAHNISKEIYVRKSLHFEEFIHVSRKIRILKSYIVSNIHVPHGEK